MPIFGKFKHLPPIAFTRSPPKELKSRLLQYVFLWLPIVAIIIIYLPSLDNGFVWDDHKAFTQFPYYRDIDYLWRSFTRPLVFNEDYYRPITSSTFIIQNYLLGLNTQYLHLTSILIHCINTLLLSFLVRLLVRKWNYSGYEVYLPLFAGLLYGLHPAVSESVLWISGRFDQLVTFFLLALMIADQGIRNRIYRPVVVGLLFLLAALSKEMAVSLALVLPMIHLAYAAERSLNPLDWIRSLHKRNDLYVYAAIIVAGCVYLFIRYNALGYLLSGRADVNPHRVSSVSNFLLVFRSLTEYLGLMLYPFNQLTPAHPVKLPLDPGNLRNWFPLIMLVVIFLIFMLARRIPRSSWMALAVIGSLIPVINIISVPRPGGSYFSEVYLTFPTALLVLSVTFAAMELWVDRQPEIPAPWKKVSIGLLAFWLLVSILVIRATIPIWNSDHSLWLWASTRHPESSTAQVNLANALVEKGRFEEALVAATFATETDPENSYCWVAKGRALGGLERYEEAAEALQKAIVLSKGNADHWVNLAIIRTEQGHLDIARDMLLEQALPQAPEDVNVLVNLGIIYQRKQEEEKALFYFQSARKLMVDPRRIGAIDRHIESLGLKN